VNLNDFWRFNVQTRNGIQLAKGPSERYDHCLEWDQGRNQLILFGGAPGSINPNELFTYSIKNDQWQQVIPVGTLIPPGRAAHTCASNTQSSTVYVHGGLGSQQLQDLWQFNFTSSIWTMMDAGNSNVQRHGHSMRFLKSLNSLLVFYGYNQPTRSYPNTIYQYSFSNPSAGWTLFQASSTQMPSARAYFSTGFNPQTEEYFVFGGSNGNNLSTNISA
jgi:hypothetical protein